MEEEESSYHLIKECYALEHTRNSTYREALNTNSVHYSPESAIKMIAGLAQADHMAMIYDTRT